MIFLTLDCIVFGVDALLAFMTDRAAVESRRPAPPPDGARAIRTVVAREFPDGVTFNLDICSHLAPAAVACDIDPAISQLLASITTPRLSPTSKLDDLGIEMSWHFAELPPQPEDRPGPELVTSLTALQSWCLRVSVCEQRYPWIAPPRKDRDLRKVRSSLDRYAQPRLILPERDVADFREDFIALIALFATKAQCFAPRYEQLPRFFRSYCDRFFRGERERKKLSEAEWYGVVDRVFQRLFSGNAGMGFTMPVFAGSFRRYVAEAIRGQAASARPMSRQVLQPGRFPSSIKEAATNLEVSHMTVRRWMSRLHFHEWTEEAWMAISVEVTRNKQWQQLTAQLRKSGLQEEAARKRVQRYKRSGLTPDEARRQSSSATQQRGTCTACGEEQAAGELHAGEFLCGMCYAEKTGHSLQGIFHDL